MKLDGYQAFMEHMCPGSRVAGMVPPPGTDTRVCPKPIMGVYDDHDFGWNNGNRRYETPKPGMVFKHPRLPSKDSTVSPTHA